MGFKISRARMDADNGRVDNATFKQYGETTVSAGTGTTYTVNLATGNTFKLTLTSNCAISFSNPLSAGTANIFTIMLVQDGGSRGVTWPAAVKWGSGTAPTLATAVGAIDTITFMTVDGGTRYFGFPANSTTTALAASSGYNLFTWGNNTAGTLGLGDIANRSVPVQVGTLTTWADGGGRGQYQGFALRSDNSLWSWGSNSSGALGLLDTVSRSSPTQVGALRAWSTVTAGERVAVALKTDGTLWSWGTNNLRGVLGQGDAVTRSSPTQIGTLATWASVAAGNQHVLAVRSDGTLWSWGTYVAGAQGLGNLVNRSSPTQIGTLATWASAFGSKLGYQSFALKTDGTLWAWGYNGFGGLGLGDEGASNATSRSSPTQVGTLATWVRVVTGDRTAHAIKTNGSVWAWGYNTKGSLGVGDFSHRSSPTQVGTLTSWSNVGVNAGSTFLIRSDNTLWTTGFNTSGQLGLGDVVNRSSPTQVTAATGWVSVLNGGVNSTAVLQDLSLRTGRSLWVWGSSSHGQLGLEDLVSRSSPVQIGGPGTWSSVVGSQRSLHGVKNDGTIWSWGYNTKGQLGFGDVVHRSSPVQIGTLTNWSQIIAGNYSAVVFGIKADATLWAWGYNSYGVLGTGNSTNRSSPVQVGTLGTWAKVASGRFGGTVAVKTDGTLWSWGKGSPGMLGQGNITNRNSPVQVGTLATWATAIMSSDSAAAVKTDGTLWTWGLNSSGQLGLGTDLISRSSPVQVGTLATWAEVATSGVNSFMARQTSGTMWSWGNGSFGNLGLLDRVYRSSPVQIGTLNTWSAISGSFNYTSFATRSDGTLWTWGLSNAGYLGLGDVINRSSPTQVGTLADWASAGHTTGAIGGHAFRKV